MIPRSRAADVAVIGLGAIGLPVSINARTRGFSVQGWNRTPGRAQRAIDAGVDVVAELASIDAPVVLAVLPDMPQILDTLDRGLQAVMRPGDLLVVMSTVSPSTMRLLALRLARSNISVIDAPVSGGDVGAWEGTLSIMVGGTDQDLARCRPLLDGLSRRIEHLGPLGAGQLAKACNQIIVGTTLAAIGEALALSRSAGLDDVQLLDVLRAGLAGSRAMEVKRPMYLTGDYSPGGTIANQLKDLRAALETADELGLRLPVTALVADIYQRLSDEGRSGLDHSAIVMAIEIDQCDAVVRPADSPPCEPQLTDPIVDPKAGIYKW